MTKVAILVPVLRRPKNIIPLINSIKATTGVSHQVLFLASPNDDLEIQELTNTDQSYLVMDASYENRGDYARKINHGFNSIKAEWYFLGADDLRFHPGWFEKAMLTQRKFNSCVIGTNDMGNPTVIKGQHSTHSLVLGEYVTECGTIDEPGKVLHEKYCHNFVDSEFVETAKWRGAWSFSALARVEHMHPDWKKGNNDGVYKIGKSGWDEDRQYFEKRKKLWP